jgi:serine protease Do
MSHQQSSGRTGRLLEDWVERSFSNQMNQLKPVWWIISVIVASFGLLSGSGLIAAPIESEVLPSPVAQSSDAVVEIAKQITVRVLTNPESGSGVLVARSAQNQFVLTCDHVIASRGEAIEILTSDGKTHVARRLQVPALKDLDLALLEFQTDRPFPTVAIGEANTLSPGAPVYATGFPNYRYDGDRRLVSSTRDWGNNAYQLTRGEFSQRLDHALVGGYRLGYSNNIEQGMSGGPVLDGDGRLVGINGRLKDPLQGIAAYLFADGTRPSEEQFQQMAVLSWAIPVTGIYQSINEVSTQPSSSP